MKRVMMLVFPTLWSPKKTSLYFAKGASDEAMAGRVPPTAELRLTTDEFPEFVCRPDPDDFGAAVAAAEADAAVACDCAPVAADAGFESEEASVIIALYARLITSKQVLLILVIFVDCVKEQWYPQLQDPKSISKPGSIH